MNRSMLLGTTLGVTLLTVTTGVRTPTATGALGVPVPIAVISLARAQSPTVSPVLVFDAVTVVDVQTGARLPAQRVVITGTHITAVGVESAVQIPAGARVVDARGKYLIPGLWDMHIHSERYADIFYPLFLVNGVTGIRDAGSPVPLDTLRLWRGEILSGARVGPPRQILSGPQLTEFPKPCSDELKVCIPDSVTARRVVDSLKSAGADMIKTYTLRRGLYFAIAGEARRIGIPFGGHIESPNHRIPEFFDDVRDLTPGIFATGPGASAAEASDRGASIVDHLNTAGGLDTLCYGPTASVAGCQPMADRFRRNGTWFVPTLNILQAGEPRMPPVFMARLAPFDATFWWNVIARHVGKPDQVKPRDTVHVAHDSTGQNGTSDDSMITRWTNYLAIVHRVGFPILAGTDVNWDQSAQTPLESPGFTLHEELARLVLDGLTPLEALQSATLNPARCIHGTDSLGTVAPGKLADLVLLDADPLVDITNTTTIRAVIANGRYYDRATLDQLLATVQTAGLGPP